MLTEKCPRARIDENGAHDLTDVMRPDTPRERPVLYCRRCGQWSLLVEKEDPRDG